MTTLEQLDQPKCSCGTIITSNDMFNKHEVDLGHTVLGEL